MTTQVVMMVNPYGSAQGKVILTSQNLYFHPDRHELKRPQQPTDEEEEKEKEKEDRDREQEAEVVKKSKKGGFIYRWKDKKWRWVYIRVYAQNGLFFLFSFLSTHPPAYISTCIHTNMHTYIHTFQIGPCHRNTRPSFLAAKLCTRDLFLRRT